MFALLLSLLMLASAPLIYVLAKRSGYIWRYFENLLSLAVCILVVVHLLPESIRVVGLWACAVAFVGLALPSFFERIFKKGAHSIHVASISLACFGLALHGVMDGAALSLGANRTSTLSLAVLLHRIPAALFVFSVFFPKKGLKVAMAVLALLGLATISGYVIAEYTSANIMTSKFFYIFQALTCGSLLHISIDRHDPQELNEHGDHHHHHH